MITVFSDSGKSPEILLALERALADNLAPVRVSATAKRVNVRLPALLRAQLERRRGSESLGAYASGLIAAVQNARAATQLEPEDPALVRFRPIQAEFARLIDQRLGAGAIVLAEGSTGIGKTHVLARLASRHPGAIVAAPSVAVLLQNLTVYQDFTTGKRANVYLGRSNYVSEQRLAYLINSFLSDPHVEPEEASAARLALAWYEAGAAQATEATAALHEALDARFLLADLRAAAPGFPALEVLLTDADSDEDAGAKSYARMRAAQVKDLPTFCTHSALIWDARLRRSSAAREGAESGLLPDAKELFVDEAHLLAGIAEASFTQSVALRTVLHSLNDAEAWRHSRNVTKARESSGALRALLADFSALADLQDTSLIYERIQPLARKAIRLLKPFATVSRTPGTAPVLDFLAISRTLSRGEGHVTLSVSPVYRYPSLSVGPRSLRLFWQDFWERVERAVLTSATLYLPRIHTTPSPAAIERQLTLPRDRVRTMPPVVAPWVTQNVQLITVADHPQAFLPPGPDVDATRWHDVLAEKITQVWPEARGGTLVLCTSYDTIGALKTRLGPDNADIIAQKRGRFDDAERDFRACYARGGHPLWLATAQAWTGVDLSLRDGDPANDFLLTDLIIPRVPLGTEHSRIHRARVHYNAYAEFDRAAMQFRQGVGRLVRGPELRERRLIILDGRIWAGPLRGVLRAIDTILEPYRANFTVNGASS